MDANWKKMYSQLRTFFSKNGHSRVLYRYKENPGLGRWVQKQRAAKSKLGKNQIALLNKVNFVWPEDIRKEKNKHWLVMFKRLEKFKIKNGHCNVPSKYAPEKELGRWVEVLRTKKEKLEDWKISKLASLGFKWSNDIQREKGKHWYTMYRKLEKFYDQYGHSSVPEYWKKDPQLSIWVITQRRPKKPLSKDKIRLLNELKFQWNNSKHKRKRDEKGRFISLIH